MAKDTNQPRSIVDVTGLQCPATTIKIHAALRRVKSGERLQFVLREGDQIQDVPVMLKEEGHRVVGVQADAAGFRLLVVKNGLPAEALRAAACCPGGVCGPSRRRVDEEDKPAPGPEKRTRRQAARKRR